MNYTASIVQAIAGEDFTLFVYFSDGTVHKADIKPLIAKGGVFAALTDESFFKERLTVINGAVAWDVTGTRDETKCIDLDPAQMYESPIVSDPIREAEMSTAMTAAMPREQMLQDTNKFLKEYSEDYRRLAE